MIDLFHSNTSSANLLPYEGEVKYFGALLNAVETEHYFNVLINTIAWQQDEVKIAGKILITKRKVAWYGNQAFSYVYSGSQKKALPWTNVLLKLKALAELKCNANYNSCLLNLYHSGEEGVGWHSDNESSIQNTSSIASISFGAERRFDFKHKVTKQKISVLLENGSLLEMKGETQKYWQHCLPKTKKIRGARVNLTFRKMLE